MEFTVEEMSLFLESLGYHIQSQVFYDYSFDRFGDSYVTRSITRTFALKVRVEKIPVSGWSYECTDEYKSCKIEKVFHKEIIKLLIKLAK